MDILNLRRRRTDQLRSAAVPFKHQLHYFQFIQSAFDYFTKTILTKSENFKNIYAFKYMNEINYTKPLKKIVY